MTLRWMRVPSSSFKLLMVSALFYIIFDYLKIRPNPFTPMLFISYPISESAVDDVRYAKGWLDLVFIAYHIIVFSFIRQFVLLKIIRPMAVRLGIRKEAKLDRFGEQAYAMLYYGAMGFWGMHIMASLPTWWYRTEYYWIDYPHWDMKPRLKRYYLMHLSYWIQQLLVLALKLEKPRKDFKALVAHHLVTLWLIGWSYGINLTLIGNAVFVSMDIPDTFLAFSQLCNKLNLLRTKIIALMVFLIIWTYFRLWMNMIILYSVWTQFDFIPESSKRWSPPDGVWMVWWMKYQIFVPLLLLLFLNFFWYYLILRIAYRAAQSGNTTDDRSDDEDDGQGEKDE
ncbi:longevity assurance proteins LAG1/LAC1 [Fomitiporia mediterranea MF3/22]|uniref:longevity assurance proteins LAG1/LAC1 n=1 Tax=Fomitiporia mediterranea (strain MF3/22) TaxID=694068 RepID=UPI0004408D91|nr:longevity assurance proteins LAG1/LAC1 [Fomitiporia mediterranea MF3/22]EJD01093.1 longevity assurance proteins LAG1/LAC1 [Fomitiporia mediterranea MF3/22]